MQNYKVSQQYPGSNNNTITLKAVLVNRTFQGSLQGDWKIVKNNKVVSTFVVVDNKSYNDGMAVYHNLAEELELTAICEMSVNLDKY
tara:strand:+ start:1909 stop:2169 length:261 start_codon:yes stop_codon:yes gene_type:complete